MRQLGDQELERMLADSFAAGYRRAAADFERCLGAGRDRRRRWWRVAGGIVLKALRGG